MLLTSYCLCVCVCVHVFKESVTIFTITMIYILQYSFYSLSLQRSFYPAPNTQLFRVRSVQKTPGFLPFSAFVCFCDPLLSLAAGVLNYLYQQKELDFRTFFLSKPHLRNLLYDFNLLISSRKQNIADWKISNRGYLGLQVCTDLCEKLFSLNWGEPR